MFGWSEPFKNPAEQDIPAMIQMLKTRYYLVIAASIGVMLMGSAVLLGAPRLEFMLLGLFLLTEGCILLAMNESVTYTRMAMYWTLLDSRNRTSEELRRAEAADL
jgi:hypothetical protein